MPDKDPESGQFVRTEKPKLVHPALRPRSKPKSKGNKKQRRTIVRTIKLVNPYPDNPVLIQVPIEPSHNNMGTLKDPTLPIRFYLNKGYVLPHEFEGQVIADGKPLDLNQIFCAVSNCWKPALASSDPEGSERCAFDEDRWNKGLIRYAMVGKEDGVDE